MQKSSFYQFVCSITLLVIVLYASGLYGQTITSFTPSSGPVGTLVTITGTNLSSPTAFTIGGASAIVISNTGTSLVGMVMPGAATGGISLTKAGGTANSATNFTVTASQSPNAQQGNKLVGSGNAGAANQGYSVSVSADGNTAIVGGYNDNSGQGAAWIYTRSGGIWSQQGSKLVGTGNTGGAQQGISVSLSADGNTAIVGGYLDNSNQGAAWIYTRSGGVWSQQGNKLIGTGNTGAANQGFSVSLSADGNTAIVGGYFDNSQQGAAWIYTRSGGVWSQQGRKLVGTGNTGAANQGISVSLSADGNTAIVGGNNDNSSQGAAWVYTRSGGIWSQQGSKLVGTGNIGAARQGYSVSVSADGSTAIVGGFNDNSAQGAAWIYTRSGGVWSQQGSKLVGTGNIGSARQGLSVSLSADGSTAIVGGYLDNSNQGAAWIYTRSGGVWSQQGSKLVGTGNIGSALQGFSVSLSAAGNTAIVGGYFDNSSQGAAWAFTYVPPPPTITTFTPLSGPVGSTVTITGTNFNTTASNNIVFFGATKATVSAASATSLTVTVPSGATHAAITVLNTATTLAAYSKSFFLPTFTPNKGSITSEDIAAKVDFTTGTNPISVAIGDIDGDGKPDLAVANLNSATVSVLLNTGSSGSISFATKVDFTTGTSPYSVAIGDIDGDGKPDLAIANYSSNAVSVLRNTGSSGSISFATKVDFTTGTNPFSVAIGDIDGDGKPDLVVANSTSNTVSMLRNTGTSGSISFATTVDFATGTNPYSVAIGDIDGDGKLDLAVANNGSATVSVLRNTGSSGSISFATKVDFTTGTNPFSVAIGDIDGDGKPDLAIANSSSATVSVLRNNGSSGSISFATKVDFTTGGNPRSVAIGDIDGDGKSDLAIANYNNTTVSVLRNTGSSGSISFATKVDFTTGSFPFSVAFGDIDGDGKPDLVVANSTSNTVSVLRNKPVLLSVTGTLSALSTTYGTSSSSTSFTVSGTGMGAGITVTPPAGFEVSQTVGGASGYAGSGAAITVGSAGTIASTTIYVRLSATAAAGTYSGNIVCTSTGATTANVATVSSTINAAPLTITASNVNKTYGSTLTGGTGSTAFTSTGLVNSETIGTVTIAYATGSGNGNTAADAVGTYTGKVTPSAATGGTFTAANYTITYATGNIIVGAVPLTITASNANKAYGSTLTGGAGSTAFTSTGLINSETIGSVTIAYASGAGNGNTAADAVGTYTGKVTPSAASGGTFTAANYTITYATGNIIVVKAAQTITFASLPAKTFGEAAFNLTASGGASGNAVTYASSNIAVATVSGSTVTIVGVGTTNITASQAGNANYNAASDVVQALTVGKAAQTITFASLPAKTFSDAAFNLTATGGASGNAVTYAGSNTAVATVSGSTVIIVGVGTTNITASQAGNANYNAATNVIQVLTVSDNAALSGLTISSGILSPAFTAATTSYSSSVGNSISSIRVTPTVSEATMSIKVNGTSVNSGDASSPILLSVGPNAIEISVTSSGGAIKTYSLSITRAAQLSTNADLASLSLSSGTLSPSFASGTYSYTTAVSHTVSAISLTPVVTQAGSTVKVNGVSVNSGSSLANIALNVGSNSIVTTVTAQDGNATRTYTLNIIRAAPNQAIADASGNVTLNNATPQLLVTSSTQPLIVNITDGTTNPTINYSMIISGGGGILPKTTITSSVAVLDIPSSTTVSSSGTVWNGILSAPAISTYTLPNPVGEITNTGLIIEMGSRESSLSFDRGVRLLLPGQRGMLVAHEHAGVLTEITTVGSSDTQAAGDALPAKGTFKIDVGNDLVIWTKAFSRFITFTRTIDPDVAKVASDKLSLTEELIKGGNPSLAEITGPLTNPLPVLGSNGSTITWVSDNPSIISNNGQIVSRPELPSGDATVNFSAIVTKGRITSTQIFTLRILAQPNQAPTLGPIANQVICYTTTPQNILLTGITPGRETYQAHNLSVSSTNTNLFSDLKITPGSNGTETISYIIKPGVVGNAIISVTVKDNGGVANGGADTFVRSFTIQVNALPAVQLSSSAMEVSKGNTAVITSSGGTSYSWATAGGIVSGQNTAVLTVRPAITTRYTVNVTNASGCTSSQSITINVVDDYQALEAMNIMTPNGDGVNDFLIIKNLDMYPNNTLRVFDKAGRQVYTEQNYANKWAGTLNGSTLAEGTYYYFLDFANGKGKIKGFVSIAH